MAPKATSGPKSLGASFGTTLWHHLNESKCKELRISFTKSENPLELITINNTNIEVVPPAKLLGVMRSNDLKWNMHVEMIRKKVSARLYFLR